MLGESIINNSLSFPINFEINGLIYFKLNPSKRQFQHIFNFTNSIRIRNNIKCLRLFSIKGLRGELENQNRVAFY